MKPLFLFLLLLSSGITFAGTDTRDNLDKLGAALDGVRQEQQSAYQSYQMTQELRRMEVQEGSPPMMQHPYGMNISTPPPNYDEVIRTQMEREKRIQQYTSDLKNLSMRYLELENQRKALLEQIRELAQHADE